MVRVPQEKKETPVFCLIQEEAGFVVQRNGRYLMTPAGNAFIVPSASLAEAIVQEWRAQGDKIKPSSMPITQLAATTLDIVRKDRTKTVEGLLAYVSSELLCQRAEWPESLSLKQAESWQPFLDWCASRHGAVFEIGAGVMPVRQKSSLVERLRGVLDSMDDYVLAGLSCATDSAGSLVLGLALADGAWTAADVLKASELDVTHQSVTWGDDPVTRARQEGMRRELEACERWFGFI